jgi:hypothetical protein
MQTQVFQRPMCCVKHQKTFNCFLTSGKTVDQIDDIIHVVTIVHYRTFIFIIFGGFVPVLFTFLYMSKGKVGVAGRYA